MGVGCGRVNVVGFKHLLDDLLVAVHHFVSGIVRVHIVGLGGALAARRKETTDVLSQKRKLLSHLLILVEA